MQNILIIMADQLTALALGCYHNADVKSPHIDRLAAEGVIFDAAYSSSPLCTPARYAFMTGQNISACGGYDNAAYMPATMPTFAHYLRLMGYRSCLSGKMHFVGPDQLHGFEERVTTDIYPADFGWIPDWENADERIDLWYHNMSSVKQAGVAAITNQLAYDDEVGAQATRVLYDHARSEDERPLCLVASFIHPHDPYATRQKYWDLYEDVDIAPPAVPRPSNQDPHNARLEKVIALDAVDVDEQEIINARRAYYGNVSYIDEWVGRLRATLDDCGMADNTTILFTADHGDMLGEFGLWYKMSFREWSNRIPLIVHQPGRFEPRRVAAPVAQVDVLPTLVDIAADAEVGQPPAPIDPLHGRSLLPLCDGDASNDPDACVSEYLGEGTAAPMLMIRRGKYKYICCSTDPEQLFDLENDPFELYNLVDHELLEDFRREAAEYWNSDALREIVIADQKRRRAVHAALRIGRYHGWDFNPARDASEEYTRSHLDLTRFDITSRFPRPPAFNPKSK
ncbi:MAG: choline-sulfatase [Gammaproteobacteria bacterium]|nr:choline-sulfatase [Gammaproteobacteria bacterium]